MQLPPILKIILFSLTALLFYHSFRESERYLAYLQLLRSKQTLEEAVLNLEKKQTKLTEEITKIKNSKSYAKKVLRDNYHLLDEEDERIVFFSD